MSSIRLIINYSPLDSGNLITLSKEDQRYLFHVLRTKKGKTIHVTDGQNNSYLAKIIDRKHIKIIEKEETNSEDSHSIFLCQSLLKGEKMDLVIQKATELGVKKIFPYFSERSIIKETRKIERWQKVAKEASEQSGRSIIPEITHLNSFENLIKNINNGIIFWERGRENLINAIENLEINLPIYLLIGPEGGFTDKEIEMAKERQLRIVSLGRRILRAETAAIVSLALTNFLIENYGIIKK